MYENLELWWVTGAQLLYGGDAVVAVDGHQDNDQDGKDGFEDPFHESPPDNAAHGGGSFREHVQGRSGEQGQQDGDYKGDERAQVSRHLEYKHQDKQKQDGQDGNKEGHRLSDTRFFAKIAFFSYICKD